MLLSTTGTASSEEEKRKQALLRRRKRRRRRRRRSASAPAPPSSKKLASLLDLAMSGYSGLGSFPLPSPDDDGPGSSSTTNSDSDSGAALMPRRAQQLRSSTRARSATAPGALQHAASASAPSAASAVALASVVQPAAPQGVETDEAVRSLLPWSPDDDAAAGAVNDTDPFSFDLGDTQHDAVLALAPPAPPARQPRHAAVARKRSRTRHAATAASNAMVTPLEHLRVPSASIPAAVSVDATLVALTTDDTPPAAMPPPTAAALLAPPSSSSSSKCVLPSQHHVPLMAETDPLSPPRCTGHRPMARCRSVTSLRASPQPQPPPAEVDQGVVPILLVRLPPPSSTPTPSWPVPSCSRHPSTPSAVRSS